MTSHDTDERRHATDERQALDAAGVLETAAAAFRHSLDEVHADDDAAWATYSRSLDDAVRTLEAELRVAGARLEAERAVHHAEVDEAVASAQEALQERLDTLRVRAHLGRMDAESGMARTLDELEHRAVLIRTAARRAGADAATTIDEARRIAGVVIDDIVELVRLTAAAVRDDDLRPPGGTNGPSGRGPRSGQS